MSKLTATDKKSINNELVSRIRKYDKKAAKEKAAEESKKETRKKCDKERIIFEQERLNEEKIELKKQYERNEDKYDNALLARKKAISYMLKQKENIQSENSQFIQDSEFYDPLEGEDFGDVLPGEK